MSQFIKNENQTLLWNIINKTQHSIPENIKIQWFKQMMKSFYNNVKQSNQRLSKKDLENLNKQFIHHFIDQIKNVEHERIKRVTFREPDLPTYGVQDSLAESTWSVGSIPTTTNFEGGRATGEVWVSDPMVSFRPMHPVNKKEIPMDLFTQRQTEYDSMLKREVPEEPIFKEMIEDTAIVNMEELLSAQKIQRELDFQQIIPLGSRELTSQKTIVQGAKHPSSQGSSLHSNIGIKIQEQEDNIVMEIQDLETDANPPAWFAEFMKSVEQFKEDIREEIIEIRSAITKLTALSVDVADLSEIYV